MTQGTKTIEPDTELDAPKTQDDIDTEGTHKHRTKHPDIEYDSIPRSIIYPSIARYETALSLKDNNSDTYLVPIKELTRMEYNNGKLYINGKPEASISIVDIRNNDITQFDSTTLAVLYGVVWTKLKEQLDKGNFTPANSRNYGITIYAPDLARILRSDRGNSGFTQAEIDVIVRKINDYANYIGIIDDRVGNKVYQSKYPLLIWSGYDGRTNTISFLAPFLNRLVMDAYQSAVKLDIDGRTVCSKNGIPRLKPVNSYLMKASIASERNKRACEIVRVICNTIERTGNNYTPRLTVNTIIDRVSGFREALNNCKSSSNRTTMLRKAFSKAFELLKTKTYLKDVYKDIKLPTQIPTSSTYKEMCYYMPHKGKNQLTYTKIMNNEYEVT